MPHSSFSLAAGSGATLHCGMQGSCCGDFSCGAQALGMQSSVVEASGLSSCSSPALDCWLRSYDAQA